MIAPFPWLCRLSPLLPLLAVLACSQPALPEFHSLVEQQAFVTEIDPPDRSVLKDPVEWTLHFSERLDLSRLQSDSVLLLANLEGPKILEKSDDFLDDLDDGELTTIPLQFVLEDDERTLTVFPEQSLSAGIYYLVVTPRLRSANGVPFKTCM